MKVSCGAQCKKPSSLIFHASSFVFSSSLDVPDSPLRGRISIDTVANEPNSAKLAAARVVSAGESRYLYGRTAMKRVFAIAILLAAGIVAQGPAATEPAGVPVTATESALTQTAPPPPPEIAPPASRPDGEAATLPYAAEKVWYRTGRMRIGLAWEKVGALAVTEKGVELTYKDGKIVIAREEIRKIERGHLPPDLTNTWVIVRFQKSDGTSAVAGFTTPPLVHGNDDKIYAALTQMLAGAPR